MAHHFAHPRLTPNNTQFFLNEQEYTISLLQAGERVTQQHFTKAEWKLLRLFFREERSSFLYEEGLSALLGEPLEMCYERVQEAKRHDEYNEDRKHSTVFTLMKPVRQVLLGCRERLHELNLDFSSIVDYGYDILPYRPKEANKEHT